jgi:hypothetical protein
LDEGIDEFVVFFSTCSRLLEAEIEFIVEQFFIVRPAVEDYGERSVGMDAGAECCKDELGD